LIETVFLDHAEQIARLCTMKRRPAASAAAIKLRVPSMRMRALRR
jgi:hypothetical protein